MPAGGPGGPHQEAGSGGNHVQRKRRVFTIVAGTVASVALVAAAATAMGWTGGSPWGGPAGWGGPGMMSGMMGGMMGGPGPGGRPWSGCGGGMMQDWGAAPPPGATPIGADEAARLASQSVARWDQPGLEVGHIMEFDNGFYVIVKGPDGKGAFELLVDRYGRWVRPEPGPNMMWNTRYGHMGGWRAAGQPTVSPEQALRYAQAYLDQQVPGARVGEIAEFPGYYTIDVARDGKTFGMLSVNAYTGHVWYHTWHGTFLDEAEAGGQGEHDEANA